MITLDAHQSDGYWPFWTDRVPLVSRLHSRKLRAVIPWTSCTTLWLRWSEPKTRPSATRATYWYQPPLRDLWAELHDIRLLQF